VNAVARSSYAHRGTAFGPSSIPQSQSAIRNQKGDTMITQPSDCHPQIAPSCAATTRGGSPCRAHPRPGSDYCPFHDPTRAAVVAAGRRKGGSQSKRRVHPPHPALVASLLARLIATAVDTPERLDTARLEVLSDLAPVLLEAVERSGDRRPRRGPRLSLRL
jgi:hypothetical protein